MKTLLFIVTCFVALAGCMTTRSPSSVGTWKMTDQVYYLRIYPDGQAAIWPSPPDGKTSWTTFRDGKLVFGYQPPLHDPSLSIRGSMLVVHTNVTDQVFGKVLRDIDPPQ